MRLGLVSLLTGFALLLQSTGRRKAVRANGVECGFVWIRMQDRTVYASADPEVHQQLPGP